MKLIFISAIKKILVVSLFFAFAGHALAASQRDWFSGSASGASLSANNASWTTNVLGDVTVNDSFLEIDLPTNTVVKLTPDSTETGTNKKTCVAIGNAVFTPVLVRDIDNSVVEGSQTALTVAYDESNNTNYYAYITNTWVKLTGSTPSADSVDVTVVLDYSVSSQTNVSFRIGSNDLSDEHGSTAFPIAATQRVLSHIDMSGCGKLQSIVAKVEENVAITPQTFEYGADFTNVTVTAAVSSTAGNETEYYLTWGNDTSKGVVQNGVVTFRNVPIDAPGSAYQEENYKITAKIGDSPIYETDGLTTKIADVSGWIDEREGTTGTASAGGTWTNQVTYASSVAAITDENKFVAGNCSTGDLVTITFKDIRYAELSDIAVETPDGTQGAFALAETNINSTVSTNFMILAKPDNGAYVWKPAVWTAGTPGINIDYTVEMSFDYVANKYSVFVSDGTKSGYIRCDSETKFDICVNKANVSDFVFKGTGTLAAIKGVESRGYTAKDKDGSNWYVTLEKAISQGRGPFVVLRETGAAPSGWKFVTKNGVKMLVKAGGMFFFAF